MSRLFDISAEFAELYDQFDAIEDLTQDDFPEGCDLVEYKEELRQAWFDTLDAMEQDFDAKAENTALYIKQLQSEADALNKEIKRLQAKSASRMRRVAWLKAYLTQCMDQMHLTKSGGVRATVSLRNSPPSVQVLDETALIEELQQKDRDDALKYSKPEIRKSVVKDMLQHGETLENACITSSRSLQIR